MVSPEEENVVFKGTCVRVSEDVQDFWGSPALALPNASTEKNAWGS